MTDRYRFISAWPLVVALALLLVLQAALGLAMMRATAGHLVYPLDDTYIQMAIAKNLAAPVVTSAAMAWRHGWPALPTPILLKQRL